MSDTAAEWTDDEVRSALADRTPGTWRVEDDGDLYIVTGVDRDVASIDVGREYMSSPRQTADAWLMSRAPALAAEVLRLRALLASAKGGGS